MAQCVLAQIPQHLVQVVAIEHDLWIQRQMQLDHVRRQFFRGGKLLDKCPQVSRQVKTLPHSTFTAVQRLHIVDHAVKAAGIVADDRGQALRAL